MKTWVALLGLGLALAPASVVAVAQNSAGDKLVALIEREQTKNVKRSTGTYAFNCFTDDDLVRFRASGTTQKIIEGLKNDAQFKAVVAAVTELPEFARSDILAKARKTAQPTYAMTGYVDPSGKSQTDAGRVAELDIAAAICDAVRAADSAGR